MRRKVVCVMLAVLALFMLIGCSAVVHETDYSLRYPSFPEEPRFAYIRSYYGSGDEEYLGLIEKILGASTSDVFQKPISAVFRGNFLYVSVKGESAIAVIDTEMHKILYITYLHTDEYDVNFKDLAGLAVSAAGNIYFCDPTQKVVYMIDKTGFLINTIGEKKLEDPFSVALDEKSERLYVADRKANAVHAFSMTTGEFLFTIGQLGENDGEFKYPQAVAVDKRNGNIVVGDTENFRIQVFNDKGVFLRKWGRAGDGTANFLRIASVAVNSEGHVYVADVFKHRVTLFDENGALLFWLGGLGSNEGRFRIPMGISIDEQDRLIVADLMNGRVQVLQYLSETWKKDHPEEYKKYLEKPAETKKPAAKRREVKNTH